MRPTGPLTALWSILCDVSHNNINSLALRHIFINPEEREELVINASIEPQLIDALCSIFSAMFEDGRSFCESCFVD